MKKFVVTIARENGSGGRAVGEKLAQRLGVPFYNRDLLRLASDESGISEQLFARADEEVKRTHLFRVAQDAYKGEVIPPDRDDFVSNENLFRYQARVILELARTGMVALERGRYTIDEDTKEKGEFDYGKNLH